MSRRNSRKSHRRKAEHEFDRRTPVGASPGTVEVDPDAPRPAIKVLAYDPAQPDHLIDRDVDRLEFLKTCLEQYVTWVDVDGLGDRDAILKIGEIFGVHPLTLEDVVNVHQRPKVEHYDCYQFIVARMPVAEAEARGRHLETEQLSLILGRNYVITFQEGIPGDCFDMVRLRIREATTRVRRMGADFLAYALLDAVVDSYFPVLEDYGQQLEVLEDDVLTTPDRHTITALQLIKRDLLTLRRVFWPLREAVGALLKDPSDLLGEETRLFLRDCYDHTVQLIDLLETYRELAAGLVDLYLSAVSNKMNEVIKVLTIISTIFIPLSFIAGVYGMNFDPESSHLNMPETRWAFGYPFALLLMAVVAASLLFWMWRRGWLSSSEPPPLSRELPADPREPAT